MNTRVAIVTGAGSGVGRAASIALGADGWTVWLVGRRQEPLDETAECISSDNGTSVTATADVTDVAEVAMLFERIRTESGRLDLLFNNAGSGTPPVAFEDLTLGQWQAVVNVNLTAVFLCAQHAVRLMKAQKPKGGRIINNGSISAQSPRPHSAPYTATKHAVTGLTKSISLDGRPFDISCGQIDIGNAATPMTEGVADGVIQADGSVRQEPTMSVEHVGRAVAYMASLPPDSNVLNMTVMANAMPYVGRG